MDQNGRLWSSSSRSDPVLQQLWPSLKQCQSRLGKASKVFFDDGGRGGVRQKLRISGDKFQGNATKDVEPNPEKRKFTSEGDPQKNGMKSLLTTTNNHCVMRAYCPSTCIPTSHAQNEQKIKADIPIVYPNYSWRIPMITILSWLCPNLSYFYRSQNTKA